MSALLPDLKRRGLIAAVLFAVVGCSGTSPTTEVERRQTLIGSPLAVIVEDPDGSLTEAVTEGTLEIVDGCLTVRSFILVWPDARTTWIEESQSVIFVPPGSVPVEASVGDRILVVGSGDGVSSDVEWLNLPCKLDQNAYVSDVEVQP